MHTQMNCAVRRLGTADRQCQTGSTIRSFTPLSVSVSESMSESAHCLCLHLCLCLCLCCTVFAEPLSVSLFVSPSLSPSPCLCFTVSCLCVSRSFGVCRAVSFLHSLTLSASSALVAVKPSNLHMWNAYWEKDFYCKHERVSLFYRCSLPPSTHVCLFVCLSVCLPLSLSLSLSLSLFPPPHTHPSLPLY